MMVAGRSSLVVQRRRGDLQVATGFTQAQRVATVTLGEAKGLALKDRRLYYRGQIPRGVYPERSRGARNDNSPLPLGEGPGVRES